MKENEWDVFISYSSKDKEFANNLANLLQEMGLEVWYDDFIIEPMDSITNKINEGLAKSKYGIVILSQDFLKGGWPEAELNTLFRKRNKDKNIVLPIWHNVTFEDLEEKYPLIIDIKAINSSEEGLIGTAKKIKKVLKKEVVNSDKIIEYKCENDTDLVILPIRTYNINKVIGVSKYLVTNKQYKNFILDVNSKSSENIKENIFYRINGFFRYSFNINNLFEDPVGEHFIQNKWVSDFKPWEEKDFNGDDKPIVCVSLLNSIAYTLWLNYKFDRKIVFRLLTPNIWNFAAMGNCYPTLKPHSWLNQTKKIYHNSTSPAKVQNDGERMNERGISDMFGNVWEWCEPDQSDSSSHAALVQSDSFLPHAEIKGGGYLDDINQISPFLTSSMLKDEVLTKHSDLGFRIMAFINLSNFNNVEKEVIWCYEENKEIMLSENRRLFEF
jgi:formylglycine-generating enzyme required for sulfatase activity